MHSMLSCGSLRAARELYELFYHLELLEAQLDNLIRWAKGRAPQ